MKITRNSLAQLIAVSVLALAANVAQADDRPTSDGESHHNVESEPEADSEDAGKRSDEKAKRLKARRDNRRKVKLEKFDKDGDGELSAAERTAAKKKRAQLRKHKGGKGAVRGKNRRSDDDGGSAAESEQSNGDEDETH